MYPVTLTVAKLESAGSRFWGGGFVRGWRGHRRGRRPAAHSANMQATQAAGLDEMSVEEKAVEIARLRKQTAAASQRLDQANQQAALLDVSLDVEPEPASGLPVESPAVAAKAYVAPGEAELRAQKAGVQERTGGESDDGSSGEEEETRVVQVAVVGTRLVPGTGWLSSSTTEYAIEATTGAGRKRTVYRSYMDLKMLHLGWVEPLSAVGMPPTFPVDVLFGANDDAVVKERRQQLHIWLVAAFDMARTLGCPLLDDALQRALADSAEARQVGLGADHVRSHLPTVIKGAIPPGPRAGIKSVWDCSGYWTWGSASDFTAQRKTNPQSAYRAPDAGAGSPGRGAGTIPHVLEISSLTGDEIEGLGPIVKAQQLNPEVWGPPPGGVARLLAKDGPLGGELQLTGVWRSLEAGSKLEFELHTLDATDCWGHVWSRKGVKPKAGNEVPTDASGPSSPGGLPSAIQLLDVRVPSLSSVKDLKLATDAAGTIDKFGLETTGLWKGVKIVAVNQKAVDGNVAIFEALNEVEDSGTFGADLMLVSCRDEVAPDPFAL